MNETTAPIVTVQMSDDIAREMTYVRQDADSDLYHVVSMFRHGRVRFYHVTRREILDEVLPIIETTKEHTMSKQVHVSHSSCDHDKTPAARARCRRIRRGGAPETTKAQIVARVKGTKSDEDVIEVTPENSMFDNEAPAPVLRELLAFEQEARETTPGKKVITKAERRAIADTMNAQVRVVNTVQAKNAKVVHVRIVGGGLSQYLCTKQSIKDDATLGAGDMSVVTCKNCIKIENAR
jgi:hypothetical protein